MYITVVLLSVIILIITKWLFSASYKSYWTKRGVEYCENKNILEISGISRPLYAYYGDVYRKYSNAPAVGVASLLKPTILVRDPKNLQYILGENFKAFYHRGIEINDSDLLGNNILFLNGPVWKLARQKMTPLFTSSKLKNMHYIMDKSAKDFVEYLNNNSEKQDAFDTLSLFCCAAITAAVFGVGTGSTLDSPFLNMAKESAKPSLTSTMKLAINTFSPKLFKLLDLKLFGDFEKAFIGAVRQVLNNRESDNIKRHDFPELALSLKREGILKDQSTGLEIEATIEFLAAQGFFFLIAGVEPSATGMFFTLFELSKHPDIQKRLQNEVDQVFEEHGENLNFDIISKMAYLDMVIEESLRKYPPIGFLSRRCTEDTILPAGNISIEAGTQIIIPVKGIHYDATYYPDPEKFDPERFTSEAQNKRPNMTFMPFGEGKRLCIGSRFAYLQMKTGLVHILRNFNIVVDELKKELQYNNTPIIVRPQNTNFFFVKRKR